MKSMESHHPLNLAIVTGGKSFDVPSFYELFSRMKSINSYIQHLDDYASSKIKVRSWYDGVLFFTFMREPPRDTDAPPYSGCPEAVLKELKDRNTGIILMHHACLSFPGWNFWDDLCGLPSRELEYYSHDEHVPVHIRRTDHPITCGLKDWTMTDEIYRMAEPSSDCNIILESTHPDSIKALAWTRTFGRSRLFCSLSGHDSQAWNNPNYIRMMENGIQWTCYRNPESVQEQRPDVPLKKV